MKLNINSQQLNLILEGLLKAPIPTGVIVCDIHTDTRTLAAGQTFVALSGERFDGHQFIDTAIAKGANLLIVEREQTTATSSTAPQIIVTNTRLALGRIAAAVRDDFVQGGGKVVGLTGSAGKTTNKQMLASIFSQVGHTHATKGNLNNDLGVPFTWFAVPEDAEFAVIEMGANHQGEIDYLAGITRPQVAMITNAGEAHLEGFGGLDGVAKGKGELFQQLLAGDTAVINLDDNYADYWRGLLAEGVAVKTFSLHNADADVFATDINDSGQLTRFTLNADGKKFAVSLPVGGWHNVMNALGCTACALALGVDLTAIVAGLEQFEGAKGRLQTYSIGTLTVIDDTYNANPLSMRASSDILAAQDGYKIMVIGEMGELGNDALQLHADLGRDLQGKADVFLCLGDNMTAFADNNDRATHFSDLETLNNTLLGLVKQQPSATILVKGSRSMQMERVVELLTGEKQ